MSSVSIAGDTSGSILLAAPAIAGGNTATLPAATGTVMVSGNMPAFSAYLGTSQSVSGSVLTKILFDTKDFDTNNNFASSRFTPTVAGYYQLNANLTTSTATAATVRFYKNGIQYAIGNDIISYVNAIGGSILVYLNGSTDYVEVYGLVGSGTFYGHLADSTYPRYTYFSGSLVRAA